MAKLDRLGWAAGISFRSHGLRIGLRSSSAGVMDELVTVLPFGWKPARSPIVDVMCSVITGDFRAEGKARKYHVVYIDNALVGRSSSWAFAVEVIEKSLRYYVAEFNSKRVFVHAGVVGWGGKAIVIPGMTHAGKSTLVAELVRRGAEYYSDELAVFDAEGRVHPYPIPIQLRDGLSQSERRIAAAEIGGITGTKPLRLSLVLDTRYKAGASWRPRRVSAGESVLSLMKNSLSARRQPELALKTFTLAVSGSRAFSGVRGEAAEFVSALERRLEQQGTSQLLKRAVQQVPLVQVDLR